VGWPFAAHCNFAYCFLFFRGFCVLSKGLSRNFFGCGGEILAVQWVGKLLKGALGNGTSMGMWVIAICCWVVFLSCLRGVAAMGCDGSNLLAVASHWQLVAATWPVWLTIGSLMAPVTRGELGEVLALRGAGLSCHWLAWGGLWVSSRQGRPEGRNGAQQQGFLHVCFFRAPIFKVMFSY